MARISLTPAPTFRYRITRWLAQRRYGVVPEPLAALGHHMQVGRSIGLYELQVARWRRVPDELKDLAIMAAAARIGCSWCMDFGYWESTMNHGVAAAKLRAVPAWRDSDVFTGRERAVLEYAEAMTQTPAAVTDEMTARLREHLTDAQIVELTAIVAVENHRSRINAALGLTAQGFTDRCEAAARPAAAAAGAGGP